MQFCAFLPFQSARGVWRQSAQKQAHFPCLRFQSARGVWRQSSDRRKAPSSGGVPICTGRVEAKVYMNLWSNTDPTFQSARGVWRQSQRNLPDFPRPAVPICTGRVEAKAPTLRTRTILKVVPICTGRVEAKRSHTHCFSPFGVPICTGRVEAKAVCVHQRQRAERCNLHGACGGKAKSYSLFFSFRSSNLHGACGGKGRMCTSAAARGTLQSARGVWRQRQDCGCHKMAYCRCNLHGTCRETERHHPSPEKNPRKFMQTYCIFIHLGV